MIKNYTGAKFININGKFVPFEDERDLITILNGEIERLNNIINELEKDIQKEIDRTNDLILEDGGLREITAIRKMLNETRQCILFRIKELKEGNKNENLEKND